MYYGALAALILLWINKSEGIKQTKYLGKKN